MKIVGFGDYAIPQSLGQFYFNPIQISPTYIALATSGVFDNLGEAIIRRQGTIKVGFIIHGTSWNEVDTQLDEAKKVLYQSKGRDLLKLTFGDDAQPSRQALARCLSFKMPFSFDDCHLVRCDAEFKVLQSDFDAIVVSNFNSNLASFDVDNSGSTGTVQRSLIIRINGLVQPSKSIYFPFVSNAPVGFAMSTSSQSISALAQSGVILTNTTNGLSLCYDTDSDPLLIGQYRDIDCGSLTVVDELGNNKREFLTIGSNQVEFMKLETGINSFTLNPVGVVDVDFTWQNAYI